MLRSADTLAMYCVIAEKSAFTRAMMARCGSVRGDMEDMEDMKDIVAGESPIPDE